MMRDKITNECVPKDTKVANAVKAVNTAKVKPKPTTSPKPKAKLARCPNGTRRNPKTLLCEVKRS
jgi:hypothetical protein